MSATTVRRQRGEKAPVGDPAVATPLARNWRLWAALPARVRAIAAFDDPTHRGAGTELAVVARPTFPRGVCGKCGCTWTDPCPEGCAWVDATERLCTSCLGR